MGSNYFHSPITQNPSGSIGGVPPTGTTPSPTPPLSPSPPPPTPPPNVPPVTLSIIVRDLTSDITLPDVAIEIQTKEELIKEKTVQDGTFKVQIRTQVLEEVYVSLRRSGYKSITRKPINLSVDPNKARTFYLEPEISIKPENPTYTATINTNKQIYAVGETIQVEYSELPGKYSDFISLVDSSISEKEWNRGERRDNISTQGDLTFDGMPPGSYEIRAYYNYREGRYYKLIGRFPFKVQE